MRPDPCNKRFEEVMLRLMVGITAVLLYSTIIFHFCYHRINKNHGRRVCYGSTIASFVVCLGWHLSSFGNTDSKMHGPES